MKYFSILIIAFSLLISCKGRIFNNPFDPEKDERGYEILSIISIEGGRVPVDITFSGDSLWITDTNSNPVSLNYTSGSIIRELYTTPAIGICYDGANLWITGGGSQEIFNISIINGEMIRAIRLSEGDYYYLDFRDPHIYLADKLSNSIITVDPATGAMTDSIKAPSFAIDGFCFDGSNFWILEQSTLKIFVTDTDGNLINTFRAPTEQPSGLAFSEGVIWMGDKTGKIIKLRFD